MKPINVNDLGAFARVGLKKATSARLTAKLAGKEGLAVGSKYRAGNLLGRWGRSSGTADANRAVRTALLEALGKTFHIEGVRRDEKGVVTFDGNFLTRLKDVFGNHSEALGLKDFQLKDGKVRYGRPLTQRRIVAIVNAAKALAEERQQGVTVSDKDWSEFQKEMRDGPKRELAETMAGLSEDRQKFLKAMLKNYFSPEHSYLNETAVLLAQKMPQLEAELNRTNKLPSFEFIFRCLGIQPKGDIDAMLAIRRTNAFWEALKDRLAQKLEELSEKNKEIEKAKLAQTLVGLLVTGGLPYEKALLVFDHKFEEISVEDFQKPQHLFNMNEMERTTMKDADDQLFADLTREGATLVLDNGESLNLKCKKDDGSFATKMKMLNEALKGYSEKQQIAIKFNISQVGYSTAALLLGHSYDCKAFSYGLKNLPDGKVEFSVKIAKGTKFSRYPDDKEFPGLNLTYTMDRDGVNNLTAMTWGA